MNDDNLILVEGIMAKAAKSNFAWESPREILHHPEDLLLHFAGKTLTDPSSGSAYHPSYHPHIRSRVLSMQMEHLANTPLPLRVAVKDGAGSASGTVGNLSGTTSINLRASGTLTFQSRTSSTPTFYRSKPRMPERVIAKPPGYLMARIASGVFFFSPKTVERVFEEIVADYRYEMIKAEAGGKSKGELRRLRAQHWGGFLFALALQILHAIGSIVKVLKGG